MQNGSTSLAREDIFRTPTADRKTFCDRQIKVIGGLRREKNKAMASKSEQI
jgi:hypothetical protein